MTQPSRRKIYIALAITAVAVSLSIGLVLRQLRLTTGPHVEIVNGREVYVTTSGLCYIVAPAEIQSIKPKDEIPSIDQPVYVSVEAADAWIEEDELVLALTYNGIKRVYPLQILVWHEIVNDTIAGEPVLVTYCPLCGSGIAYERMIEGEEVEFGTSGRLYNSNFVMYDRRTNTYWSQIDGLAIVGVLTGMELSPISIDTVAWRDWRAAHPDSEVLSRETGFSRPYGRGQYASYYEDSSILFPVSSRDDRIHPKTVIFGIEIDGVYAAYCEDDLIEHGSIEDEVSGVAILVSRDEAGTVSVINLATSEEIVKERDFWFAWYAFHPNTLLHLPDQEE